ncbi:MAG TPA: PQQ-binding-like beta-propeller repeat protein [Gemmataceae bacterium]|nr:PQQ-binding-like beta-propeller repeat protein [Gemmataceae bacterium]
MRRLLLALTALGLAVIPAAADDWPQWLGPRRDGVWREKGILDKFPKDGLKVRWRVEVGAGYSGPAVAAGRVFLTDFVPDAGAKQPGAFDDKTPYPGRERLLCLGTADGARLWKYEHPCEYHVSYASGPRATPLVDGDRVYALGTMGHLACLGVKKGDVIWSKELRDEYEGSGKAAGGAWWGFAAHPLIDGDKLICLVGGKGSIAVAFDKKTGKELWRSLSASESGYAPPMIYEQGGKRHLIIWNPDGVASLDPETGKPRWTHEWPIKAGLSIPTPRLDGDKLFLTAFYDGSLMLKLKPDGSGADVVYQSKVKSESPRLTTELHSIMPTPFLVDGHVYGVCSYGELRCLEEDTGKRVWMTREPTGGTETRWANAFLVRHDDRFFLFNEKGDLIIARLSPKGYDEIGRAHLLDPDNKLPGRAVVWSHPAFADRAVFARNDHEIVCVSLAAE